jgi:sugar phosphate isomerase/epimerase
MATTRRDFIKTAGVAAGAALIATKGTAAATKAPPQASGIISRDEKQSIPFTLGLASYSFRAFSLDEAVAMTRRLGLDAIALKSVHLALDSPPDAVKAAAAKVREAGLDLYGCGVVYMRSEADIKQAFDYARAAGLSLIIGVPDIELLPLAEKAVREYDIRLALHNHGPTDKVYPTPESAYLKIRDLDPRIGLCLDAGHAARSGLDPANEAEKYFDRLLDVHVKDVTSADVEGGPVEIGRGVVDIPNLLRALVRFGFGGKISLEYEKDEKDPLPGAAESVGYLRGVLDTL